MTANRLEMKLMKRMSAFVVAAILALVASGGSAEPAKVIQPKRMAVWDFDGTILDGDCTEGLVRDGKTVYEGLLADCIAAGFARDYKDKGGVARFRHDYEAKIAAGCKLEAYADCARIFAGADVAKLEAFCRKRFHETLARHLYDYSLRRFRELEAAGVENHVVSASADFFVQAAAGTLGVPRERIHGILVEIRDGKLTDRIIEPFPYGEGKTKVLRALEKESGGTVRYGFGNSYSTDGPFLKAIVRQGGTSMMINGGKAVKGMTELFVCTNLVPTVAAAETRYLDEMDLSSMSCGMRLRPERNRSVRGKPLRLGSATNEFARGVGTHVESVYVLEADGRVECFDATVGLDWAANEYPPSWDTGRNWGGVSFRVYADGEIVADTGVIKPDGQPRRLHAKLDGARLIVLEATDCGDWAGYRFGHADWAEARFTCAAGAVLRPHPDRGLTRQLGVLTPPEGEAPRINGAGCLGVRPGHAFLYRLPVTGRRPVRLSAAGLPAGVSFDAERGVLSGRVSAPGDYALVFTAENAAGSAKRDFALKVGERIALTPPMGWNHWNLHAASVRPEHIRAAADGMVRSGLADHGWCYVNVDDGWNRKPDGNVTDSALAPPARNPDGTMRPNDRFADMKGLADYVHGLGLKIGIYSSPGRRTCGGFEGSYAHEDLDAKSFAAWGFDYLKYDWCSYGRIFAEETKGRTPTVDDYAGPYRRMTAALRRQDRDIVHAFCQYGMGDVQSWGRDAGAQVWRSHNDLKDSWKAVLKAVDSYGDTAWKFTGPGFWCDPDMLVVGYLNADKGLHESDLTPNEQYTHITLWCMLNAPLLLGCDLNRLSAFTRNLLVNDEVLAVNQDPLGRTARRIVHTEKTDVWTRPLADGSQAVAVVNRFPYARRIAIDFAEIGLGAGSFRVRDLWRQRDLGIRKDGMELDLPGHAAALYRFFRCD